MSPSDQPPPFTDSERNAMRAYLQRSEVRMSTLHRIATAFVSGAGLLILIPVFVRDIIEGIIQILLASAELHFEAFPLWQALILTLLLYTTAIYPFILSLLIPLYSLYLLLKDIVHFYYSIYAPGFPATLLHPTFSLSGIAFSQDESPRAKREIMHYEYSHNMDFMMPFSEGKRELYFDHLIEATQGEIIPSSRKWDKLVAEGMIPEGANRRDIERFDAALGVVRSLDRTLVEEVAVTEMHLARSVLYLRRLVLRYAKSLLLIVWTTMVTFIAMPFLQDERFSNMFVLSVSYLIWSLLAMQLLRWPIQWLYRHRRERIDYRKVDRQLMHLDGTVRPWLIGALPISLLAVLLSTLALIAR